jgi:hypothetical protein
MAVSSNLGAYVQLKLSGGTGNQDGNSSLGGVVSSKTITSQTVATLLSAKPLKRFAISAITSSAKRRTNYLIDSITQNFTLNHSPDPFILGLTWINALPANITNLVPTGLGTDTSYALYFKKVVVSTSLTEYYAILIPDVFLDNEPLLDAETGIQGTKSLLFESTPWSYGVGYPTWNKYYLDSNGAVLTSSYAKKILSVTTNTSTGAPIIGTYPALVAITDPKSINGYIEFGLSFAWASGVQVTGTISADLDGGVYPFQLKVNGNSYKKFAVVNDAPFVRNTYTVTNLAAPTTDIQRPDYKFNNGITGITVLDSGGWAIASDYSVVYDMATKRCAVLENRWQEDLNYIQAVGSTTYNFETIVSEDVNYAGWRYGDWSDVSINGNYKLHNSAKNKWLTISVINSMLPVSGNRFQIVDIQSSNKKNELFDSIKRAEAHFGDTEYRSFYIANTHATEAMWQVKVYIDSQPVSGIDTLELGLDPAGIGNGSTTGVAVTIVDESTAPVGVTFTTPTKLAPLVIGDLLPYECAAVWIKRTVPEGVECDIWDNFSSIGVSGLI